MLVVFDVDGTLVRTVELDAALYARAFAETVGWPLPSADWTTYRHVTDRGIAEEALARLGRRGAPALLQALRDRFLEHLDGALGFDETRQVAGAAAMLARLRAEGHTVAVATGAWEASARLKLARAGLAIDGCALAACDDEPDRVAILRAAIARAGNAHGRVVYVGDGPWDADAARTLGLPFVGIDHDASGRLGHVASVVLRDYADGDAFVRAAGLTGP
jgi:phosphoglycolate phosphatase-like HAD superfamily hydrolase